MLCSSCCDDPSSDNSLGIKTHVENLVSAFHSLVQWRNSWERDFPSAVSEILATKESNLQHFSSGEIPHRTVYRFENLRRAKEIVFFYGTLLHLFDEMVEWMGPNAADLAIESLSRSDNTGSRSPLMPFHGLITRGRICSEVYRSLDYLLDGPDPVSGAVQLVYPLRACDAMGHWRVDRIDMINVVPIAIWDRVVRLSGFEMLHPMRVPTATPAIPLPMESPLGVSDDEMSVLDPALRDSPMRDSFSTLLTLGADRQGCTGIAEF